jgi:acyl transferase domain-containing protein/acyl carrier protein
MPDEPRDDHIAVIGMACRFPGANTLDEYWHNLCKGVESVTWLTEEDLASAGVPPREFRHPHYVNAALLIEDMEYFDARFFGYTPREAEVRDPQGRWFLEACYAAVQDSGYDPERIDGLVGVVGGMANNLYAEEQVKRNAALSAAVGPMAIGVGSAPDYLATTVSYRLGLRGPSLTVQTACSTSLLAVHTASQLLRSGECDYAVAGGVEVELPARKGHLWMEGNIYSRDGHIRPFDAEASGTIFGSGVGAVALKRLADAIDDGDHVYAVLRGSAVNNDGGDRAGFTAPGVEGQVQLIVEALAAAKVHPDTIGFVEAHATGTLVGDPIEVAGLNRAYRAAGGTAWQSIPIGSVKANIGHLGPASGIAGLIKVCLALKHRQIPPNINYERPNPNLDLSNSPFYVVTELTGWPAGDTPRRAGVSSFGIGGTNVHVIVEEALATKPRRPAGDRHPRRWHTIPVSAKTATAAAAAARDLGAALMAGTLRAGTQFAFEDAVFTAQNGRPAFAHRYGVAAQSRPGAAGALTAAAARPATVAGNRARAVAMMFPGQGTQHVGMGRDLYDAEPAYRDAFDECARVLLPHLGVDIRDLVFAAEPDAEQARDRLRETRFSQPTLFAVEYSLATLLATAGITPARMIGHSIGEYVAACLAGVFSLRDALAIVAARGRLMQEMAPGAMLAVEAPAVLIQSMVPDGVEVAAVNSHRSTVVAGPVDAVAQARAMYEAQQIACTSLATSHAFHTSLMEPCLKEFAALVADFERHRPALPFVSNVTGTWITDEDAVDPEYWARHLRSTVLFADGVSTLISGEDVVLLEVGPGDTLARLARQVIGERTVAVVAAMRQRLRSVPDDRVLAEALGALWCHGAEVDWLAWTGQYNRVPLPAYPFERQRYWAEPDSQARSSDGRPADEADWPLPAERCSFQPVWREAPLDEPAGCVAGTHLLVFTSGHPVVDALVQALLDGGATVTIARPGASFAMTGPGEYTVRPPDADDLRELLDALAGDPPAGIVHAFCVTEPSDAAIEPAAVAVGLERGFYSLLHLGQQLARRGGGPAVRVHVLSSNMQEISSTERLEPAKALLLGPVMLTSREVPGVTCRSVDIALPGALPEAAIAHRLLAELTSSAAHVQVGWRGRKRWQLDYQMAPMDPPPAESIGGGTYLITGGLGALGLVVAEELASRAPCTIVLLGRSPVPPREHWPALIAASDPADGPAGRLARVRAIEESGSTVVFRQCDVADELALAAAICTVHKQFGRIQGVFHSAGVAGGAMMAVRTDAAAAAVLAPKVDGALALYRLLADEVDFLVLFSSLTAATGTFGQVDYCAANNFLDAFARWAAQQGRPVYSIGWMQWTESGMYTDREDAAPQAFRELQTGVRYEPATHPLLDRRIISSGDTIIFSTQLEPGSHWIASEHRLDGKDVVVGTALLEMIDAAYREAVGGTPEIRDVVFLGPIGVTGPTEIRVELRPDGRGHSVTVTAAAGAEGRAWTERLRGRIEPMESGPVPAHDLAAIRARCSRLALSGDEVTSAGGMIDHGAHWAGNLRRTEVGDREEVSLVEISERYRTECGQFRLHPALLDTAVAEANFAEDRQARGENYLPFSYGRVRVHEPLPPRFWVHMRHLADPGADVDRMAVLLMHEDGQEIAHIDEYAERRVDPAAIRAVVDGVPAAAARRPATPRDQRIDEASVTPELGRDVLRRILHWRPAPHLLVVPEGIHRNLRRTQSLTIDVVQRELSQTRLTGGQERLVDTEFVAAETETQRTIAQLWGAALGVSQVGLDDTFFDMGGNSLVAVQLAARMREALDVELPIAVLFDHPTVRALAEFVSDRDRVGVEL